MPQPNPLVLGDARGRPLRDLRISVTDRCNFRCAYCMPKEQFGPGFKFLPRSEILRFEEILRLSRIAVSLGVQKLRLTGGEPLLRSHLSELVCMLSSLKVDLALTTNGSLLSRQAEALWEAGLRRITVSLDSLDDSTFRAMNDVDFPVSSVLEGIDKAARLGMAVKVNCVVRRDRNLDSLEALASFCKSSGHTLRFIEYMDVGATNGWNRQLVVPGQEILERLESLGPLRTLPPLYPGEVAQRFGYADGSSEVGLINSVSDPFCGECSRARLSARGELFTCLFATSGLPLRDLLRDGCSDAALKKVLTETWSSRTDAYSEERPRAASLIPLRRKKVEMSYIGG